MLVTHKFPAEYDENSKILILGSIPSVKSREKSFYYMHPQNRFWRVLAAVFNEQVPKTIEDKKKFLKSKKIALWDVLSSCEIQGSSDSTIKNPVPNDIKSLIKKTEIKTIFVTGKKAENLYNKYCLKSTNINPIYLPSASPANQTIKYEKLLEEYKKILKYLK